jgi:hypothetical protein
VRPKRAGPLLMGRAMTFTLAQARYDRKTKRAYVELRDADDDGGDMLATAIFSFRTKGSLSDREVEQDVMIEARHVFKKAAKGLDST